MPAAWRHVSEHCWLVPGGVNAVVLEHRGRAVLIDSGPDRDSGKRLLRGIRERSWKLEAILTSHAHADHFGGHAALLRQLDVPVLAPPVEAELMRAPLLEPSYLFHGAAPLAELTSRWFQAEASRVDQVIAAGPLTLIDLPLELLAVDGHAHRQLALRVDDVLVAADAVFAATVAARHPLLFAHDVRAQADAAALVGDDGARLAIPGHGEPDTPAALAQATLAAIDRGHAAIRAALEAHEGAGATTTQVLRHVAQALGASTDDLARWHLLHTTVSAYLSAARARGTCQPRIVDGALRWFARSQGTP